MLPTSTATSIVFQNCLIPSPQQYPPPIGNQKKIELFGDLFPTSLMIHKQRPEEDKKKIFHSLMRGDALHRFKIEARERRSRWYKFANSAVLNINTSHHTNFRREPTRMLQERAPFNVFDLKKVIRLQKQPFSNSQISQNNLEQT